MISTERNIANQDAISVNPKLEMNENINKVDEAARIDRKKKNCHRDSNFAISNQDTNECIEGNIDVFENLICNEPTEMVEDRKRCRICLHIQNLTSIFESDSQENIAASIMLLCPTIKIFRKDNLPQYICETCLQSLRIAMKLKTLGETTDKELRSKSKQKKKVRETEFVIIDCSGAGEIEENVNLFSEDDEFHPPSDYDKSEYDSNTDSSFDIKKCKTRRSTRNRRKSLRKTRLASKSSSKSIKSKVGRPRKTKGIVDDGTVNDLISSSKNNQHFQCVYCDQKFQSLAGLREHKKKHVGEKPFKCGVCERTFKFVGSYRSHQEKHKFGDDLTCTLCSKHYPNKTELKRHLIDVHNEAVPKFLCTKCKRPFTSQKRLSRHNEGNCPGIDQSFGKEKKSKTEPDSIALGRDLFKCVAPLTTTYWSDSFSD